MAGQEPEDSYQVSLQRKLEALAEEIESLRKSQTRLRNQVKKTIEQADLLGFQEQLNSLNTQVKALRQDLLKARRTAASNAITIYIANIQMSFAFVPHPTAKAMHQYLSGLGDAASKRVQETTEPEKVTMDVFSDINDHLKKLMTK